MNTKELSKELQGKLVTILETKVNQEKSREILKAVFEVIEHAMITTGKADVTGFGKFEVKEREARVGRNPQTGEEIQIPAKKAGKFKAAKALKDALNK